MPRKAIAVFYNISNGNEQIADTDFKDFFTPLVNDHDLSSLDVDLLPSIKCASITAFKVQIKAVTGLGYDELYLHFSGHGIASGIPYDEWVLDNETQAILLNDRKIKFCFFSICKSENLARLLNQRNLPVVIGTSDNLENNYAIAFQKRFYKELLSEPISIKSAFENTIVGLENMKQLTPSEHILRGGGGSEDMDSNQLNDLQLYFASKHEEERMHLVYPDIIYHINALEEDEKIMFVFSDFKKKFSDFQKVFLAKGYENQYRLFELDKAAIQKLTLEFSKQESQLKDRFMDVPPKLVVILSNSPNDFISAFNDLFNQRDLLDRLDIKWRILTQNQVSIKNILGENTFLGIKGEEDKLISNDQKKYSTNFNTTFSEVFSENNFIKFLDEQEIDFGKRKKCILKMDCKPVKKEIIKFIKPEEFVRVFFSKHFNEYLTNFLVNVVRNSNEIYTQNLKFEFPFKSEMSTFDLFELKLRRQVKEYYGGKFGDLTDETNTDLIYRILKKYPSTFLFKTHDTDLPAFVTGVKKILKIFKEATKRFENNIPKPSYLFFINNDNIIWDQNEWPHDIIKTLQLGTPEPIDSGLLNNWSERFSDTSIPLYLKTQEIIKKIDPTHEEFTGKCPSLFIGKIVEELSIPHAQILKVS